MQFEDELKILADDFTVFLDSYFNEYLVEMHEENLKFKEAIAYSLLAEGKRLRPLLLLKTYQIFGGDNIEIANLFAFAIECIHNYSLVHDDMPCMDDDDYRRGRLSNHKLYGENIALLVGDGLLNLAYEVMLEASINSEDTNSLLAMQEIAFNAGVNGMIGGQAMEILTELLDKEDINLDTTLKIKLLKTSCLFSASIVAGAILADLDDDSIDALEEYANLLGLAFQLKDDIIDSEFITSSEENIKELSSEELTYNLAKNLVDSAKEKLDILELNTNFYSELADYMISRKK